MTRPPSMPSPRRPVHVPVLLDEVLDALAPRPGGVYLDATFGAGGYSRALLDAAPGCRVVAVDRDPEAVARGRALAAERPGLAVIEGRFGDLGGLLPAAGVRSLDGAVFDLGVSSAQLDDPARGFSFAADGPLDMRLGPGEHGPTAADVVNGAGEAELARILADYGEEPAARRIARAIVRRRARAPFRRTRELAELVGGVLGGPRRHGRTDPATRTFQALRIHVNDELGELERGLEAAEGLLRAPGGRLAVVAFHSLEDRIVKRFLAERAGALPRPSRHLPASAEGTGERAPSFRPLTRGAVRPGPAELERNP
ncbi:MAG TPA: 16S rRNA (cytosine(1402)-N(4))-methyltransferase RsmH, partial [Geminicoccaceae bacterium]|nr:16S rRNA (cytosine(1402)-N(4))-methyltransferase RsmH [Geminicoccaceae bacterium]